MTRSRDFQSAREVLVKAWARANELFGSTPPGQIVAPCGLRDGVRLSASGSGPLTGKGSLAPQDPAPPEIPKDGIILAAIDAAAFDKRAGMVISQLNLLTPEELAALSVDTKLRLLQDLRKSPMTAAQKAAQRTIYNSMSLDPDFVKWDDKKRNELISSLKENKDVLAAKENWKDLTTDQRLAVLTKVAGIQAKIYGFSEVAISGEEIPALPEDAPEDEQYTTNGYFDPSANDIVVNTGEDSEFDSFSSSINLITHENAHNFQDQLAKKYANGELKKNDERYVQAKIFHSNDAPGGYVNLEEDPNADQDALYAAYKKQPFEEHAWKTGDAVGAEFQTFLEWYADR